MTESELVRHLVQGIDALERTAQISSNQLSRHEERFVAMAEAFRSLADSIRQSREDMTLALRDQRESIEKTRVKFLPMAGAVLTSVALVASLMWFIAEKAVVDPMAARVANIERTLARPDFRTLGAAALERQVDERLHDLEVEIRKNNDRLIKLEARQ